MFTLILQIAYWTINYQLHSRLMWKATSSSAYSKVNVKFYIMNDFQSGRCNVDSLSYGRYINYIWQTRYIHRRVCCPIVIVSSHLYSWHRPPVTAHQVNTNMCSKRSSRRQHCYMMMHMLCNRHLGIWTCQHNVLMSTSYPLTSTRNMYTIVLRNMLIVVGVALSPSTFWTAKINGSSIAWRKNKKPQCNKRTEV